MALTKPKSFREWWDLCTTREQRVDVLRKRTMIAELADCDWMQLPRFAQEILVDSWWWGFVGDECPVQ